MLTKQAICQSRHFIIIAKYLSIKPDILLSLNQTISSITEKTPYICRVVVEFQKVRGNIFKCSDTRRPTTGA